VCVLLGNGDGTFQTAVGYLAGGQIPSAIAVADVNGDGKLDLLIANEWFSFQDTSHGSVGVLLGKGDGTFQPTVSYSSGGGGGNAIAVADVNQDGKLDVLVAIGGGAGVLLGKGDGTFQPALIAASGLNSGSRSLAIADLNGDGIPDLVLGSCGSGTCDNAAAVLVGNGDGTFQAALAYDSGGLGAASVAVADVNGDSRPDLLIVSCENGGCSSGKVGVLLHVGIKPTATTVVSSLNPSVFGQSVIFTASVSAASGTPTGEVAFFDGSALLGSAALTGSTATFPISTLGAGTHSIAAVYEGSLKYKSSKSDPTSEVVQTSTTATSLTSTHNPALVNQSVSYTGTVASQYGGAATGTVVFKDGGVTTATVTVSDNGATFSTKYKTPGIHALTATYSGDPNNSGSTSNTLTEQVIAKTKTVVTTSGSPSHMGQPVTFTATVTSGSGAIPDGDSVTFYDGTLVIGTGATAGGLATFTTSSLTVKTHTIKAIYAGDATFRASSGKVTQVVEP
jgi:hypothetical protein